ncbi:MAG: glutaredoxin domain-containing protein [Boseongicola sp.]
MEVEIFTGPNCGYCSAAKSLLDKRGIGYAERDMQDATVRQEFADRLPRMRSIPQIFIDGEHIGGFEDLRLRFE